MRWREGDPAAAFSLLRHIGLGWTTVDQALHQANSALEGIGELVMLIHGYRVLLKGSFTVSAVPPYHLFNNSSKQYHQTICTEFVLPWL